MRQLLQGIADGRTADIIDFTKLAFYHDSSCRISIIQDILFDLLVCKLLFVFRWLIQRIILVVFLIYHVCSPV